MFGAIGLLGKGTHWVYKIDLAGMMIFVFIG
jgi:hypothetical protein